MFFFSAKYFCLQKTLNSKTECAYLLFLYACKNVINKIAKYFWSLNSNHPKNVNKAENFFFIFKWHFLPSQFFALFSWNLFIKRVNHSENLFKKFPVFVSFYHLLRSYTEGECRRAYVIFCANINIFSQVFFSQVSNDFHQLFLYLFWNIISWLCCYYLNGVTSKTIRILVI